MPLLFIIFFAILSVMGKKQPTSIDKIIGRLNNHTWQRYEECINDSCYALVDGEVFYFPGENEKRGDTAYLKYTEYDYRHDPETHKPIALYHSASPVFVFLDTLPDETQMLPIHIQGKGVLQNADLDFISDTQLVLAIHFRNSYGGHKRNFIQKSYFRLIPTPDEVRNDKRKY
jgi:hypothetical protein